MADETPDRLAALSRMHTDGRTAGYIEAGCRVIEQSIAGRFDPDDFMRELVRMFGSRDVEREIGRRPALREAFQRAVEYIATGDTQPIDVPIRPGPNSPVEVGGTGEPGGWTGGLTHPPETKPGRGKRR